MSNSPVQKLTGNNCIRLSGALLVQQGRPLLMTGITAEDVIRHARIDTYDPKTERGYQRDPSATRIQKAADFYESGGRMPNPLLANVREEDFEQVRVVVSSGNQDDYSHAIEEGGDWVGGGYIELSLDTPLWIFDGQHRKGGIEELLRRLPGSAGFAIPLSITLGLTQTQEMKDFYDVNNFAKSVSTNLAWELLHQMAKEDLGLAEQLELTGKDWITKGTDVAKFVNKSDGPWLDHIQFANEKRVRSDRMTITSSQFISSLKPVLDMTILQKADVQDVAHIIEAYWKGITQVLPEAFSIDSSPKDWVLQKGQGTVPLHRVLPRAIEVVRARGQRLGDESAYADVMQGLQTLSGHVVNEQTGENEEMSGAEFWRVGKGVASGLSGETGRKRLFIMIQAVMPRPTLEITV